MIDTLFIDTITVKRESSSSQDAYGEAIKSESTIYTDQRCRIETKQSGSTKMPLDYTSAGVRVTESTLIYFPPTVTILEQDKFYKGGEYFGLAGKVIDAVKGTTAGLDHIEVTVELP